VKRSIWIGYDPREQDAFNVAVASIRAHLSEPIEIFAVALPVLHRPRPLSAPDQRNEGKLWDVISDAPMSTEFAISRFFVPIIATSYCAQPSDLGAVHGLRHAGPRRSGRAVRPGRPEKAIQVVKHDYQPAEGVKMDGQVQTDLPAQELVERDAVEPPPPGQQTPDDHAKLNTWAGRALHGSVAGGRVHRRAAGGVEPSGRGQ
jgi:hypothetical protein